MICIGMFGGCLYVFIEYLFRGFSSPIMFLLAFFVSQLLMILNDTILTYDDYYEDFMNDLKEDCQSPFEHFNAEDNIHIIGKYFHS